MKTEVWQLPFNSGLTIRLLKKKYFHKVRRPSVEPCFLPRLFEILKRMMKRRTMKHITNLAVAFFATAILSFVGCSGTEYSLAPVSGQVTLDGKPVASIRLVFSPMANEANTDPGPWSTGVTNAEGEYTLETRHKQKGASVGKHTVMFEFDDPEDMEGLMEELEDAREEGSKAEVDAVKKRIADFRARQQGRPKVSDLYTVTIEVPVGGTTEANFELPE